MSVLKDVLIFPEGSTKKEKSSIVAELINRRRRQLFIHSILYYNMDETLIPDDLWNTWAKQLVELQQRFPKTASKVDLHEKFEDFDGSTGFHLVGNDEATKYGTKVALSLLKNKGKKLNKPIDIEHCFGILDKYISKHYIITPKKK